MDWTDHLLAISEYIEQLDAPREAKADALMYLLVAAMAVHRLECAEDAEWLARMN